MFYSSALDESTDQTDIAQPAIFVQGVDRNFDIHVFEELLSIASLKDLSTDKDIFKTLKKVEFDNLRFENLAGNATDGDPCMIGQCSGSVAFLKKRDGINTNAFINYHCIVHQENL